MLLRPLSGHQSCVILVLLFGRIATRSLLEPGIREFNIFFSRSLDWLLKYEAVGLVKVRFSSAPKNTVLVMGLHFLWGNKYCTVPTIWAETDLSCGSGPVDWPDVAADCVVSL